MGTRVFTMGFPLAIYLGSEPRLSEGLVSANVGLKDDPDQVQVSVAIQPGNSGSPLLNENGHVIGVIQQTLSSARVLMESGNAPQNVNFALKEKKVREFLEGVEELNLPLAPNKKIPIHEVQHSIIKVHGGEIPPEEEMDNILLVSVAYYASSIGFPRFSNFNLAFIDYKSRDLLFYSGQYVDFMFAHQNIVIKTVVKEAANKIRTYKTKDASEKEKTKTTETN